MAFEVDGVRTPYGWDWIVIAPDGDVSRWCTWAAAIAWVRAQCILARESSDV